jgi:transcriptional regulator with XRE-family HTH domain
MCHDVAGDEDWVIVRMPITVDYSLGSGERRMVLMVDAKLRFFDGILWVVYALAMVALTVEARRVHEGAHLSDRQIATATGAKPSTVRDWLTGRSVPSGTRAERLVELAEMADRLSRIMDTGYIPVWLNRPIEALDDDKPVEVLARGEYRRVAELIAQLEYPGVS